MENLKACLKTKITVEFGPGRKRVYTLYESGQNSLSAGGTAVLKFKHPDFGEFFEAEIKKAGE